MKKLFLVILFAISLPALATNPKPAPESQQPTPQDSGGRSNQHGVQTLAWLLGACIVVGIVRGKFCLAPLEDSPTVKVGESMVPEPPKNEFVQR